MRDEQAIFLDPPGPIAPISRVAPEDWLQREWTEAEQVLWMTRVERVFWREILRLREEVAVLRWQADDNVHPLTCGNDSSHDILDYRNGELFCHDCDWRQPVPAAVLAAHR